MSVQPGQVGRCDRLGKRNHRPPRQTGVLHRRVKCGGAVAGGVLAAEIFERHHFLTQARRGPGIPLAKRAQQLEAHPGDEVGHPGAEPGRSGFEVVDAGVFSHPADHGSVLPRPLDYPRKRGQIVDGVLEPDNLVQAAELDDVVHGHDVEPSLVQDDRQSA